MQSEKGFKLHEVERHLFSSLLQLGLQLLGYYVLLVKKFVQQEGVPVDSQGTKMKNKGSQTRPYFSVFGRLGIERTKYYSGHDKTHHVLDGALGLPSSHYRSGGRSYLLSDWLSYGAVELDFNQSVAHIERILGHELYSMQSSRCTYHLSEKVEDFYEQKDWQNHEDHHPTSVANEEGTYLSVGYDDKGVPIMRAQTDRAQERVSTRLSKGQQQGVKKEATVSVSSSFTAKKRSVDEIIASLFSCHTPQQAPPAEEKHVWHERKHIRAFLSEKQQMC